MYAPARFLALAAAMVISIIGILPSQSDHNSHQKSHGAMVERMIGPAAPVDFDSQAIVGFVDGMARAEMERAEAERQEAERQEALRAAARASGSGSSTPGYHPGTTDGECSGFVIPDYIIQRESGGNPSAYNPSGAYGCAQTLLSHYGDGRTCQGLDPFTIAGQRECVDRLSNGGTNLAPWAMTA